MEAHLVTFKALIIVFINNEHHHLEALPQMLSTIQIRYLLLLGIRYYGRHSSNLSLTILLFGW